MGDVRLDGLYQTAPRDSRLDTVLKTARPVSANMQAALRLVYAGALESVQLKGEMNFQLTAAHQGSAR